MSFQPGPAVSAGRRPVPANWWAAKHLSAGSFRDRVPLWLHAEPKDADGVLARLNWTVTQCVLDQLGESMGKSLARLAGVHERVVQERLGGQKPLRASDLELWSPHVSFERLVGFDARLLGAEWQGPLGRARSGVPGTDWARLASELAATIDEETRLGRVRLLGSAALSYVALGPLSLAGVGAAHLRPVGGEPELLGYRRDGLDHLLAFDWAPAGREHEWDPWILRFHEKVLLLARDMQSATRVLVCSVAPDRLALLDGWAPDPASAAGATAFTVGAERFRVLGLPVADHEAVELTLLARSPASGQEVLVFGVSPRDGGPPAPTG